MSITVSFVARTVSATLARSQTVLTRAGNVVINAAGTLTAALSAAASIAASIGATSTARAIIAATTNVTPAINAAATLTVGAPTGTATASSTMAAASNVHARPSATGWLLVDDAGDALLISTGVSDQFQAVQKSA